MTDPVPESRASLKGDFSSIAGESPGLLDALGRADLAAPTPWPILITGETGTGKSALAEAIHRNSGRTGRFVALNCASLTPSLLESELFGYQKGAFTGADRDTPGLFEAADAGTLFLDEIGDMDLEAQARLLRVIESGKVRRVGAEREIDVNVRIIGATHRPLTERIAAGQFREDLFYRINSFVVHLPPLCERPGDIAELARAFLDQAGGGPDKRFDAAALDTFRRYEWPGNIRELQSVIRQALVQSRDDPLIRTEHLPPLDGGASAGGSSGRRAQAAGAPGSGDLAELLRAVMADGAGDQRAWARFLLAYSQAESSPLVTRKAIVPLLRKLRGPGPSENVLQLQWARELRGALVDSGLVEDSGKKLAIDLAACRDLVTDESAIDGSVAALPPDADPVLSPGAAAAAVAAALPARDVAADGRPSGNLPARPVQLYGRDRDAGRLSALLDESPLVTMTGPGGMGKTHLALRVGQERLGDFPGGCWFVDLVDARTLDDVCGSVAAVLGVPATGQDPVSRIAMALAERPPMLLILDNFEQILPHATATVGEWLPAAPSVRMLVTSRALLGLHGEVRFELLPLATPDTADGATAADIAGLDAVDLFVDRARRARPDFSLTDANAQAVAAVVIGLSGIPLAIELAAARMRMLSVDDIADRLSSKFELLKASRRDIRDHQRTMRHALDWSYNLLDEHEREAFARLAIFQGGMSIAAAEAIVGPLPGGEDVLDVLSALLDKSFVRRISEERYDIFVVIREYGQEKLAGLDADVREELARRHANWFCDRYYDPARGAGNPDPEWLDEAGADAANLQVAWQWAVEHNDPRVLTGTTLALGDYTLVRGEADRTVPWLDAALEHYEAIPSLCYMRLMIMRSRAGAASALGYGNLLEHLGRGVELAREMIAKADTPEAGKKGRRALWEMLRPSVLVGFHNPTVPYERVLAQANELVEVAEATGVHGLHASALSMRGALRTVANDIDGGLADLRAARGPAELTGKPFYVVQTLLSTGENLVRAGRVEDGVATYREAQEVAKELAAEGSHGDHMSAAACLYRSIAETDAGRPEEAIPLALAAEEMCRRNGRLKMVGRALWSRGRALWLTGELEAALSCLERARAIGQQVSRPELALMAAVNEAWVLVAIGRPRDGIRRLADLDGAGVDRGRETTSQALAMLRATIEALALDALDAPDAAIERAREALAIRDADDFVIGDAHTEIRKAGDVLDELLAGA